MSLWNSKDGFGDSAPFFKIKTSGKPEYLFNLIATGQHFYNTRSLNQTETYHCITLQLLFWKFFFFSYTIVDCNKINLDIRKSKSYAIFQNVLLKIGRLNQCSIYRIHNSMGLKLLTRSRLGLSYLNEHGFTHNFHSCINPLCSFSLPIESTTHFFTALPSFLKYSFSCLKQHK